MPLSSSRREPYASHMMMQMIQILTFPTLLVALTVLAQVFGVDTRDGRDWQPRDFMMPGSKEDN